MCNKLKLYESRYSYDRYDHKEYKRILYEVLKAIKRQTYKHKFMNTEEESSDKYWETNDCTYFVDIDVEDCITIYFCTDDNVESYSKRIKKMTFKLGLLNREDVKKSWDDWSYND